MLILMLCKSQDKKKESLIKYWKTIYNINYMMNPCQKMFMNPFNNLNKKKKIEALILKLEICSLDT